MKTSVYLIVKAKPARIGPSGAMDYSSSRITKNKPNSLGRDEVSMKLELDIPDAFFKRPTLTTKIEIPEPQTDMHVPIEVQQAVSDELQKQLGIAVDVNFELIPSE